MNDGLSNMTPAGSEAAEAATEAARDMMSRANAEFEPDAVRKEAIERHVDEPV